MLQGLPRDGLVVPRGRAASRGALRRTPKFEKLSQGSCGPTSEHVPSGLYLYVEDLDFSVYSVVLMLNVLRFSDGSPLPCG
jgi:hypothetical protein